MSTPFGDASAPILIEETMMPPHNGRTPTDPLLAELRGLRADLQTHERAAGLRHREILETLKARDTAGVHAVQALAAERTWWRRTAEAIAPYAWQALRTPLGTLLIGVLLLGLARVVGVEPVEVLRIIGPTPFPVQVQP